MIRSMMYAAVAAGALALSVPAMADVTIVIPTPEEHFDPAQSAAQNNLDPDLDNKALAQSMGGISREDIINGPKMTGAQRDELAGRCAVVMSDPNKYNPDIVAFCQGF